MHIKNIMLPLSDLVTISYDDTIAHALELIESNDYLSLPVVDEEEFIGVLSKKYVYETYFKNNETDKDEFLNKPVSEFMKKKIPVIKDNLYVEDAAEIFFKNKIRFIPVLSEDNKFRGIITQKAIFKKYRELFGMNEPKLVIYTYDFKGRLAKLTDIIYKYGGNITSLVIMNTNIMGLQEISIRVNSDNIDKIINKLKQNGFEIRDIIKS